MIEKDSKRDDGRALQLAKLTYDTVKENDLKVIFQILTVSPQNRTISDLDTLLKILINVEAVKKFNNLSAIYLICKKMYITKFKTKDVISSSKQQFEALYIILNGKVAFYRKASQYYETDQLIFLNPGACFGELYNWKINFITICMEQTLIAVLHKKQVDKIPLHLTFQRQFMLDQIKRSRIFLSTCSQTKLDEASNYFTWNRVPLGTYLMRQGQTPKAIFYIFQGAVRKIFSIQDKQIHIKQYSPGDFCPKSLHQTINYDLITQCICQVIIIPRKALNMIGMDQLPTEKQINQLQKIKEFLHEKQNWKGYKENLIKNIKKDQLSDKNKNKLR